MLQSGQTFQSLAYADKVNPFRLLELFFGDVLDDMNIGYIKLYNHREKADIF